MKSLGDMLRSAREDRGLTMDQAVHETNISRHYLEALEDEAFEVFPAEAYLIGFLRNYADFLGLDAEKAVGQYRNYKLSEEPAPIEQLVGPPKGALAKKILPWILGALILAVAGVLGVPPALDAWNEFRENRAAEAEAQATVDLPPARRVVPSRPLWEGELRPSDTLVLENNGREIDFLVGVDNGRLSLQGEGDAWSLVLGEEIYLTDDSGRPSWRLYLKDIGLSNGGAILEIQQLAEILPEDELDEELPSIEPPSGVQDRRRTPLVLDSATNRARFALDIQFRDFCFLRYEVDGQPGQETYFGEGETLRLDAGRSVTIWASNAGALYARIGGREITFGRRGEVAVAQLRWVLNEDSGEFDLTLLPLY